MTTFDKIKDMIVDQLDVEADEVTMDANIQEDLGADSLDIVDLIMAVEDECCHNFFPPKVYSFSFPAAAFCTS